MTSVASYQEEGLCVWVCVWVCVWRERGGADGVGWGVDVDEGETAVHCVSLPLPHAASLSSF